MSAIKNMNNQGAASQPVRTIPHTINDVNDNVITEPGLVSIRKESESGTITVILWDDTDPITYEGSATFINAQQLIVKKVMATGTSITHAQISLNR